MTLFLQYKNLLSKPSEISSSVTLNSQSGSSFTKNTPPSLVPTINILSHGFGSNDFKLENDGHAKQETLSIFVLLKTVSKNNQFYTR